MTAEHRCGWAQQQGATPLSNRETGGNSSLGV
jgi:hypothetical protein